MKTKFHPGDTSIEKKFNEICRKMDSTALRIGYEGIEEELWNEFDKEFIDAKTEYEDLRDYVNLYYVSHNYHSRNVWRMLKRGKISDAILEFQHSCVNLVKRHKNRPYKQSVIKSMSGAFKSKSMSIREYLREQWNPDLQALENLTSRVCKALSSVDNELSDMCVATEYEDMLEWWFILIRPLQLRLIDAINSFKIRSQSMIANCDTMAKKINEFSVKVSSLYSSNYRGPYILALNNAMLFRLNKKILYFHLRKLYTVTDENERDSLVATVSSKLEQLKKLTVDVLSNMKKYYRTVRSKEDLDPEQESKLLHELVGYEIDDMFCDYLTNLHGVYDMIAALRNLEKIHHYILRKVLVENVEITVDQLNYFSQELTVLMTFIRLSLMKEDVTRVAKANFNLNDDWRMTLFKDICTRFDEILSLFRYKKLFDRRNLELKIVSRAFTGGFSEFILAKMFKEIVRFDLASEKTLDGQQDEITTLLKCLSKLNNANRIETSFKFDSNSDSPDVDILIGDEAAVFVKNGYLSQSDVRQIKKEIEYAFSNKMYTVFIIVNFYRNMNRINEISEVMRNFQKTKKGEVYVSDLKDVVSGMMRLLKHRGKWKYRIGESDIMKILDY